MNKTDRGILYGMLFGDGNLYTATNNFGVKYTKLTIGHSPKQRGYLEHKCDLLHSALGGKKPKIYEYESFNKTANKKYTNLQTVKTNKYFRQMHSLVYASGTKKYTRQTLDYLTDHGLALWFMDDGHGKEFINKLGKIHGYQVQVSTYCSEEEAVVIKTWFEDVYKISPKFDIDKRNNLYSLRFNTADSQTFRDIVRPYIIESMLYKLGFSQERQTSYSKTKILAEEDDIVRP